MPPKKSGWNKIGLQEIKNCFCGYQIMNSMKPSFLFLLIFILALCQGVFLSLNLVLLVTLFWAAFQPPLEAFKIAFLAGLVLDFALGLTNNSIIPVIFIIILYHI